MAKRRGSQIIRQFLEVLKQEGELSLRSIETKLDTNNETVKDYALLLKDLGLIELINVKRGAKTVTKVRLRKTKF